MLPRWRGAWIHMPCYHVVLPCLLAFVFTEFVGSCFEQAAADERPVPPALAELAVCAMLPLLAWRLDAVEQGAPGAMEPAALGVLAARFAEQLDRLGEEAGTGRLGRVLLLVQADLLLLFSAGKLQVCASTCV